MSKKPAKQRIACAALALALIMQPATAKHARRHLHPVWQWQGANAAVSQPSNLSRTEQRRRPPVASSMLGILIRAADVPGLKNRCRSIFRGAAMRLLRRTVISYAFVIMPLTAMAETPSAPPPQKAEGEADSVHVQPRGEDFTPNSAEEDAVQKRITIFNSTQETLDESFDKKLRICRGC